MASQPITTARRQPFHWLGFDQGAVLVAVALVCRWQGQNVPALTVGVAGLGLMGLATYRTLRAAGHARQVAGTASETESLPVKGG